MPLKRLQATLGHNSLKITQLYILEDEAQINGSHSPFDQLDGLQCNSVYRRRHALMALVLGGGNAQSTKPKLYATLGKKSLLYSLQAADRVFCQWKLTLGNCVNLGVRQTSNFLAKNGLNR
jgi:hypothetical protein